MEEILALTENKKLLQQEIYKMDKLLASGKHDTSVDISELVNKRAVTAKNLQNLISLIDKKHQYLGVDGQQSLAKLKVVNFCKKE